MKRILIGQLGSYGDCLYATTIARQIKADNPDCHLTWAIGSAYKNILDNNPYVDTVWAYPISSRWEVTNKWYEFAKEAMALKARGDFDQVFLIQAYPGNPQNFYGSLRASMFRAYPYPITVPITPVVRLSMEEVEHVRLFAEQHRLKEKKNIILFEYSPQSGQSFVTQEFTISVAKMIVENLLDSCVILSGINPKISYLISRENNLNIIDACTLTFRENAELTKYCTLFVGTGSGITQICLSDWAKPLPMIQLLEKDTVASLITDHKYFGLPTDEIIEMTRCSEKRIIGCIGSVLANGFNLTRKTYCEYIIPDFNIIRFRMMFTAATLNHEYLDIIPAFIITCTTYGLTVQLIRFLCSFPDNFSKLLNRKIQGGRW